jgi:outer membrane protein OmpA-like peptidoglycan-associated protein
MARGVIIGVLLFTTASVHAQDRDRDRVVDEVDLCPEIAEGRAALFPRDGCPDVDDDRDRIVDDYDFCPSTRETVNGFEDGDGCPDVEGALVQELADRIHFATGSHELDAPALESVDRLAAWLDAHAEATRVDVLGHADARGEELANEILSERRASAVCVAVIERGIASSRLAIGRGLVPGDAVVAQAERRSVQVRVVFAGPARVTADLSAFEGTYRGDARMDVDVGSEPREVSSAVHPVTVGVSMRAYAARVVGDRIVIALAGIGREETLVFRLLGTDRAVGRVEVREGGRPMHIPWTARRAARFSQRDVIAMISSRRDAIQSCYDDDLRAQRTLRGRLAIAMTVATSGETVNVRVVEDELTPRAPSLNACVLRLIDDFRFEPAPFGDSVSFTFPFVFEPRE